MLTDRRGFLLTSGAAALGVAGCCLHRPDQVWPPAAPAHFGILAPPRQLTQGPLRIDAHTHIFNATDLHVKNFVAKVWVRSVPPALRDLVRALAPLLELIAQAVAPTCAEEQRMLDHWQADLRPAGGAAGDAFDLLVRQHQERAALAFVRRARRTEFERRLLEADERFLREQGSRPLAGSPHTGLTEERLLSVVRDAPRPGLSPEGVRGQPPSADGVLSFAMHILMPRAANLKAFQQAFSPDGATGIHACLAAMVDFQYWLGDCQTASPMADQIALYERLAQLSGGYLLPIVAYNPWTDIREEGRSLARVKDAVLKRGCVAVKIYPPMGYRPLGNQPLEGSAEARPDDGLLDEALRGLYCWCLDNGVPVMAHSAHSNGRDAQHDGLAGPAGWGRVLEEYAGLPVNLAHFGGHYRGAGSDWPRSIVALMGTAAGRMLHADLGHQEELLTPDSPEAIATRALLADSLPDGSRVYERIMYGTDWLMLARVGGWRLYADGIERFLTGLPGTDADRVCRSVFGEAAARCFGLCGGGQNRKRLTTFFGMHRPSWWDSAGQVCA